MSGVCVGVGVLVAGIKVGVNVNVGGSVAVGARVKVGGLIVQVGGSSTASSIAPVGTVLPPQA